MARRAIIATAACTAGLVVLPSVAVLAAGPGARPGSGPGPSAAGIVPGAVAASSALPQAMAGTQRFLVSFSDPSVPDAIRGAGFTVGSVLERLSIAVVVTEPERRDELAAVPGVASVSEDRLVSRAATQVLPGGTTQWNLDRIDQATNAYDQRYRYPGTGEGVRVYVIDTGVRPDHAEFSGRVVAGFDAILDGNGTGDCDGHGTHVAGTIAGSTVGVAKRATIVPVRVLGCDGTGSTLGVLAGADWVLGQHVAGTPAVVNMSLGLDDPGGTFTDLDAKIAVLVAAGITVVVAAGNGGDDGVGDDACTFSPARAPSAITVGASGSSDARAGFSNFGTCLDLFAPGVSIRSAWNVGSVNAGAYLSGTSMASPAVAGIAAVYLGIDPTASPATVTAAITGAATAGVVTSPGTGSPNRLARVPAYSVPANDAFASAAALPATAGTSTRTVSNVAADSESGEPVHAGVTGGASLWWTITPAVSGTLLLTTQGSGPDTALAVYTGSGVGALTALSSNDDVAPGSSWSQVQRSVTSGTTYRIAVDTRYATTGPVVLGVTLVQVPASSGWDGSPDRIVGGGSDSTYPLGQKLGVLYNGAPGCAVVTSATSTSKGSCNAAQESTVDVKGNYDHDTTVEISSTGSDAGINSLSSSGVQGPIAIDYARSSRMPTVSELNEVTGFGIAQDGVAVITFGSTSITQNLSLVDVYNIYTCTVTNWSSFGGPNVTIRPWSMNPLSGTYATFRDVLRTASGDAAFDPNAGTCVLKLNGPDNVAGTADDITPFENDVKPLLANVPGASTAGWLWWMSYGEWSTFPYKSGNNPGQGGTNLVSVGGSTPNNGNIANGSYPLGRTLYHVTKKTDADFTAGTWSGGTSGKSGAIRAYTNWLCKTNNAAHSTNPYTGVGYRTEIIKAINEVGFQTVPASLRTTGTACRVVR